MRRQTECNFLDILGATKVKETESCAFASASNFGSYGELALTHSPTQAFLESESGSNSDQESDSKFDSGSESCKPHRHGE